MMANIKRQPGFSHQSVMNSHCRCKTGCAVWFGHSLLFAHAFIYAGFVYLLPYLSKYWDTILYHIYSLPYFFYCPTFVPTLLMYYNVFCHGIRLAPVVSAFLSFFITSCGCICLRTLFFSTKGHNLSNHYKLY